jgi:hypothetical protein
MEVANNSNKIEISTSHIKPGIYYLNASGDSNSITKKVVVY